MNNDDVKTPSKLGPEYVPRSEPLIGLCFFFRRSSFLGAVLAMVGYGVSAQVMVFFLPLFLQNVYGFSPAMQATQPKTADTTPTIANPLANAPDAAA